MHKHFIAIKQTLLCAKMHTFMQSKMMEIRISDWIGFSIVQTIRKTFNSVIQKREWRSICLCNWPEPLNAYENVVFVFTVIASSLLCSIFRTIYHNWFATIGSLEIFQFRFVSFEYSHATATSAWPNSSIAQRIGNCTI